MVIGWMTEELTEEEHASPVEAAKVGNAVGFIMRPVRAHALPRDSIRAKNSL